IESVAPACHVRDPIFCRLAVDMMMSALAGESMRHQHRLVGARHRTVNRQCALQQGRRSMPAVPRKPARVVSGYDLWAMQLRLRSWTSSRRRVNVVQCEKDVGAIVTKLNRKSENAQL